MSQKKAKKGRPKTRKITEVEDSLAKFMCALTGGTDTSPAEQRVFRIFHWFRCRELFEFESPQPEDYKEDIFNDILEMANDSKNCKQSFKRLGELLADGAPVNILQASLAMIALNTGKEKKWQAKELAKYLIKERKYVCSEDSTVANVIKGDVDAANTLCRIAKECGLTIARGRPLS